MAYSFSFTSTREDHLDAQAADPAVRNDLRLGFRIALLFLGFGWASLPLWAVMSDKEIGFDDVFVGLLGCSVIWTYLVQPVLDWRRIRAIPDRGEGVTVDFDANGIGVTTGSGVRSPRPWAKVAKAVAGQKGLLVVFTDGVVQWLPARVFSDNQRMDELQSYIHEKTWHA